MAQVKLIIKGVVQGVFYRDSARKIALSLNLTGYAKNMPDGTVLSVAIGEKENILKYIKWCKQGPEMAKVENVDIFWINEDTKKDTFEIL